MLKLDNQQEAIVTSKARNILVVAGAGSGKTRVLTERIKKLLDDDVQPHNIVAITFTNLAAEEMRERLKEVPSIGDVFIGTIHSFANRIYKNSGIPYSLMTEQAEHLIYEEILNKPKYSALTYKRWLQYKDLEKMAELGRIDDSAVTDFLNPSERDVLYKSPDEVFAIMRRDNIITFNDLITHATDYYESLGATIEHLLVDELQDIGTNEYRFIRALNAENYFFVGDDWQAIYGFKGGNVEIFKSLIDDNEFAKYFLTNNYRSCKAVVDTGLRVISQIQDKIAKDVIILSNTEGYVTTQSKSHLDRLVKLLLKDKENYRDWFILTRTNREAYNIADLLDDNRIDYAFIRKSDLTLEELQDAMAANQVKILTVHSAKGLENKKVILYGNFPLVQPAYMRNLEERKVMYVGVTRAIEELHIFN